MSFRRYIRRHKYLIRISAYLMLILAAFELGKFSVKQGYLDLGLFIIFLIAFLYLKFYEKSQI